MEFIILQFLYDSSFSEQILWWFYEYYLRISITIVVVQHLLLKVRVPSQLSLNDCGPVSNTLLKVCGEVFISFRPGVYIQTFSAYIIVVIDMNY